MSKRRDEKKARALAAPDGLEEAVGQYWPDLEKWPSPASVAKFIRDTSMKPDVRLSVLSGLRHFVEADLQPLWSFVAVWVSLVAVIIAIPTGYAAVQAVLAGLVVVVGMIFLVKLASASTDMDIRRRGARVWLSALEDGLREEAERTRQSRGERKRWWHRAG